MRNKRRGKHTEHTDSSYMKKEKILYSYGMKDTLQSPSFHFPRLLTSVEVGETREIKSIIGQPNNPLRAHADLTLCHNVH